MLTIVSPVAHPHTYILSVKGYPDEDPVDNYSGHLMYIYVC